MSDGSFNFWHVRYEFLGEHSGKTPWLQIAIGVTAAVGAGYFLTRSMADGQKEMERVRRQLQLLKKAGVRPGMTKAEQDRRWDAYYAKHGHKLLK